MKKTTAKKTHKALIVFVACVLAAALSVGITLAYLTAQTEKVTNTFTASGDLSGEIQEPGFPSSGTVTYTPGEPVTKDPLVHNLSGFDIYAAVRLDYYINFTGTNYVRVPYDIFHKYFSVNYTGTDSANWTEFTGSVTTKNATSGIDNAGTAWSRYFFYETVLADGSSSGSATATTTYGSNAAYFSNPVFTTVTPSGDILLGSTDNVAATAYETKLHYGIDGFKGKLYEKMNFKIVVTGFGVKKEASGRNTAYNEIVTLMNATDITKLSGSTDLTSSQIAA